MEFETEPSSIGNGAPHRASFLSRLPVVMAVTACVASMSLSCQRSTTRHDDESMAINADTLYHADYDIAMTVRSLADAISVGQPLDSAEYNFIGVLTDGNGTPLYTDMEGDPGIWEIDVTSESSAAIRNLKPGDLLPDDLEQYITGSVGLGTDDIVATTEYDDDDLTRVDVYRFDGGFLRFENRAVLTMAGIESPLMNIVLTTAPPAGIQTAETAGS